MNQRNNLPQIISSAKQTLGISKPQIENRLMISSQESEDQDQKAYLCGSLDSIEQSLPIDFGVPEYIRPHLDYGQNQLDYGQNQGVLSHFTSTSLTQKISKRTSKANSKDQSPNPSSKYFKKLKIVMRFAKEASADKNKDQVNVEANSEKKHFVMNQYQKLMVHFQLRRFVKKFQVTRARAVTHLQKLFINDKTYFHKEDEKLQSKAYINQLYPLRRQKTAYWNKLFQKLEYSIGRNFLKFGCSQALKRMQECFEELPVLQAESYFKIFWDIFMLGIRLYFMFAIPVQIGFNNNILYSSGAGFTQAAVSCLYMDIFVNFNTTYFEVGQRVSGRKQIIKNYLENYLLYDLVSYLTLTIFLNLDSKPVNQIDFQQFFLLIFFVQIQHISDMFSKFEDYFSIHRKAISTLKLFQVLLVVLFIEHLFSCLWYFVGDFQIKTGQPNWITHYGFLDNSFSAQYITSFYFASVTMVTVGYGDIAPVTNLERLVCIFFMFISCVQVSYSVSSVGSIMMELSSGKKEVRLKLRAFNQYMQKKKISYQLQFEIRQYLSYYLQHLSSEETQLQQQLITELSEPLRDRLLLESNSLILQDCPLFRDNFSMEFKKRLLRIVQDTMAIPNGFIGQKDSIEDDLYFVENGNVHIYVDGLENDSRGIQTLNAGESFGMTSFISGEKSDLKFRSYGFSKLLIIRREDFINQLKDFPEDHEEFCQIKEKLSLYGDLDQFKQQCQVCQQIHKIQNCPKIHYPFDREGLIKRHNFAIYQARDKKFVRNKKRVKSAYNSRIDHNFYNDVVDCYRLQNESFVKLYENSENNQDQERDSTSSSGSQSDSDSIDESQQSLTPRNGQKSIPFRRVAKSIKTIPVGLSPANNKNIHNPRRQSQKVDNIRVQNSIHYIGSELNIIQEIQRFQNVKMKKQTVIKMIPSQEEFMAIIEKQLSTQKDFSTQFSKKDIDFMEELQLRLRFYLNKERILEFESKRDYKKYFKHNNSFNVIEQYNQSMVNQSGQQSVYKQFIKYMLYPTLYYKKYKTFEKTVKKKRQSVIIRPRKARTLLKKTQIYPFV